MRLTLLRAGEGRCTFLFEEKESTKGKPFWRKTAFFEKGWYGGGKAWSGRIGLYEADPPMGRVERAWRRVEVLCFDRSLFNGRKREGERTSQAFPWKGKGDHRSAMVDEVDPSSGWRRCSFFFKEKEGTEEKPFGEKLRFSGKVFL